MKHLARYVMLWAILSSGVLSANTLILHFCCGNLESLNWSVAHASCCGEEENSDCCQTTVIHFEHTQTAEYCPSLHLHAIPHNCFTAAAFYPETFPLAQHIRYFTTYQMGYFHIYPPDTIRLRVLKI